MEIKYLKKEIIVFLTTFKVLERNINYYTELDSEK